MSEKSKKFSMQAWKIICNVYADFRVFRLIQNCIFYQRIHCSIQTIKFAFNQLTLKIQNPCNPSIKYTLDKLVKLRQI